MAIDPNATPKDYTLIIYSKAEIDAMSTANSSAVNAALATKSNKYDEGSPSGIATLDPQGKLSLVEIPIATVLESEDITNSTTLMTPERVHYIIDTTAVANTDVGIASGVCPLNTLSQVDAIYLPPAQLVNTYVVNTLLDMYDLVPLGNEVNIGDRCVVTQEIDINDNGEYVANVISPVDITGWDKLPNLSAVQSVNGVTGNVVITTVAESAANAVDIAAVDGRVTLAEADIVALETLTGSHTTSIGTNVTSIASNAGRITTLEATPAYSDLLPQASAPTYSAGRFYYNSTTGTFDIMGPFPGIVTSPGHGENLHVINNSGATIEAGMAVRVQGVAGGIPQIVKAQADSFTNAIVAGVTSIAVADGAQTAIATSGVIGFDTSLLAAGGPYYLSAGVPGTYTKTPPAILTEVGGVLVSDAVSGKFRVDIGTNKSTPTVLGALQGQTAGNDTYTLTTLAQNVNDYLLSFNVVTLADVTTGVITLPTTGKYRATFTAALAFPSLASTRSITAELYDVTHGTIKYSYVKNVPKDAVEDSFSFSLPISEVADNQYVMRIKASAAMSMTFNSVSFDIESISIA